MPASHWAFNSMLFAGASSSSTISSTVAPCDLENLSRSWWHICQYWMQPCVFEDPASKSHWGSFHWFTCKNTRLLWNLAAAEVGGNDFGSTCVKLVATLSQYFLYRRLSKVSDFFQLDITTNAALPALSIWAWVAFELSKTVAACWRDLLSLNFLRMDPFPIPNKQDVLSHPRNACRNGMSLHIKVPSFAWTSLIFHTHPFVFFLQSEVKKDIFAILRQMV